VIIFERESLGRNEFPEDDSYAKYLSRNFLHTHAVTQGVDSCLEKVVEGNKRKMEFAGPLSKGTRSPIDRPRRRTVVTVQSTRERVGTEFINNHNKAEGDVADPRGDLMQNDDKNLSDIFASASTLKQRIPRT